MMATAAAGLDVGKSRVVYWALGKRSSGMEACLASPALFHCPFLAFILLLSPSSLPFSLCLLSRIHPVSDRVRPSNVFLCILRSTFQLTCIVIPIGPATHWTYGVSQKKVA